MEREHPERVQYIDALIQQLRVTLLYLRVDLLHAQRGHLQVLLVGLPQDLLQLDYLRDAALAGDDGADGVLDRGPLVLQILDLLDHDRGVLLRLEAEYAVEEDGAVVVGDYVGLPGGQELVFQVVYYVTVNVSLSGLRSGNIGVLSRSGRRAMLGTGSVLLGVSDYPGLPKVRRACGKAVVVAAAEIAGTFRIVLTARSQSTWLHYRIWISILVTNSLKLLLLLPQISQPRLILGRGLHWRFHYKYG